MEKVNKPACKFGVKCYRKNPRHFDVYSHPERQIVEPKSVKLKKPGEKKKVSKTPSLKIQRKDLSVFRVKNTREENKDLDSQDNKDAPVGIANNSESEAGTCSIKSRSRETCASSSEVCVKGKTVEEIIKMLFLVNMPPDFYSFYEFCKSVEGPPGLELAELKLVGPFNVLSGGINYSIDPELFLCHWRYYYDPPEFQTVLTTASGFHIGYWRDDPKENPVFLASNNPNKNCLFKVEAENIFGTVYHYLNELMKSADPFKKVKLAKLQRGLSDWAKKNNFPLEKKTSKIENRQKKVVSKTFHGAGIVVPVEAKTDLGYRPLIETDENLKKICNLIMKANDDNEKEALWDNLQPLITAANIANDECDFGNSLELGIDLFCMGSPVFHETVEHLLSTAYSLLNRTEFEKIIKAHLKHRRTGNNLSICG